MTRMNLRLLFAIPGKLRGSASFRPSGADAFTKRKSSEIILAVKWVDVNGRECTTADVLRAASQGDNAMSSREESAAGRGSAQPPASKPLSYQNPPLWTRPFCRIQPIVCDSLADILSYASEVTKHCGRGLQEDAACGRVVASAHVHTVQCVRVLCASWFDYRLNEGKQGIICK